MMLKGGVFSKVAVAVLGAFYVFGGGPARAQDAAPVAEKPSSKPVVTVGPVSVPNGFKYEILLEGKTPEPMDMKFGPDGRIWITGRRGQVWTWSEGAAEPRLIAEIPTAWQPVEGDHVANERGVHGIEFHPQFLENGQIYLYYSTKTGNVFSNQLSRFTIADKGKGDRIEPGSEKVYFQYESRTGNHQGGGIGFCQKDGKLYVTTGDNYVPPNKVKLGGFYVPKTPTTDVDSWRGKTLRLNLDGTNPDDNPFAKDSSAIPFLYTVGHRNPFTVNIDQPTGRVFVGEVGHDSKQHFEEINLLQAGGNYGWPFCNGTNTALLGGECALSGALDPWFCYVHDTGASAMSGPYYRANQDKFAFPAAYQNGLFYGDSTRKWIRFIEEDLKTGRAARSVPFARGLAGGPLAMHVGPDGALYFIEYAGWFTPSPSDRLSRITFTPPAPLPEKH